MLGAAAVCAGLAVSAVDRYAGEVEAQVGPPVPVVVASHEVPRGRVLTPAVVGSVLAERHVPRRFAPPDSLRSRAEAVGMQVVAGLGPGDYVVERQLRPPSSVARSKPAWSDDARLVEVSVSGARAISPALTPGAAVDVLITTGADSAAPRTFLALQRVPVVGFDAGATGSAGGEGRSADGRVTLRATVRQAVVLTAAENFAREIRVVPRAPGDTRRLAAISVGASGLGR